MIASEKALLRALAGERSTRPPLWLMRQAGRYLPEYRSLRSRVGGFLEMCYTPDYAVEATLQPIRRFGFDAAILFSDILVVSDALGQRVAFVEGEGPRLDPVRDGAAVAALTTRDLAARLAPVYETVDRLRTALPRETALIGFAGAPWTVATYMVEGGGSRDFLKVKRWCFGRSDTFADLVALLVEATAEYLSEQAAAGAEVLQLFDSHAGVLPEAAFRRWVIEPTRDLVARLRAKHPDVPIIGFPRGAGIHYPAYAAETGVTAVGLDSAVPPRWAAEILQPHLPVQGNLDPGFLLAGGTALEQAAEDILEALGGGPFVFNLGHGIHKDTPVAHVEALVRRVRG